MLELHLCQNNTATHIDSLTGLMNRKQMLQLIGTKHRAGLGAVESALAEYRIIAEFITDQATAQELCRNGHRLGSGILPRQTGTHAIKPYRA